MRSMRADQFYRDRKKSRKEFHEHREKRRWLGALRGLHLVLLLAEVVREKTEGAGGSEG